jgi:hypothetical protein
LDAFAEGGDAISNQWFTQFFHRMGPAELLRYFCGFEFLIVSHLQHEHIKLAVKAIKHPHADR